MATCRCLVRRWAHRRQLQRSVSGDDPVPSVLIRLRAMTSPCLQSGMDQGNVPAPAVRVSSWGLRGRSPTRLQRARRTHEVLVALLIHLQRKVAPRQTVCTRVIAWTASSSRSPRVLPGSAPWLGVHRCSTWQPMLQDSSQPALTMMPTTGSRVLAKAALSMRRRRSRSASTRARCCSSSITSSRSSSGRRSNSFRRRRRNCSSGTHAAC
mmetsp:Transcript_53966/g.136331  ORF Transcript_53966/g.136331 Transcript_53966/m.136331 type:complete len:210 (+) Transcript_53966:889-1518(+)